MPLGHEARAAGLADADEIVRLGGVMFESMGRAVTVGGWEKHARRLLEAGLGNDLAAFVVDSPVEPSRLIASCVGLICQRLPSPGSADGRAGYVQWVCVEAAFRGKGLGRAVMAALLGWFDSRGVRRVELHATTVAEPLYRSLGFSEPGLIALQRSAS